MNQLEYESSIINEILQKIKIKTKYNNKTELKTQ